jgi:hypothetical protein
MNKILESIRSYPGRFFLILFLLLIIPAVLLFPMAQSESQTGMGICLALIILANGAVLFS